jgi:curved DNA-binding protein
MSDKDLYADLGVSKSASRDEVRRAFRKLARELHPDKNPGNKRAEERFKRVSFAHDVLSDDARRALYDEFGTAALREGFDPEQARQAAAWAAAGGRGPRGWQGQVSLEDLLGGLGGAGFETIFERAGASPRGRARGADLQTEVSLPFADAIRGTEREIRFVPPGEAPRTIRVRIPAGVTDGGRVRLRGQGAKGHGAAGDLVLAVRVEPHEWFRRDGDDLHVDVPVTAGEARRGARITVPTAGGDVTLSVPPRTQSGRTLRLRGKGVTRGSEAGDLYVHVHVHLPNGDDPQIDEHVDAIERTYGGDVRARLRF